MFAPRLRSPVVQAVLELVAANSADEQAEVLARHDALFLTAGADGVLAVLCWTYGGDPAFVRLVEAMRISLYDVRSQLNEPAQVARALQQFLPFGGPTAPTHPDVHDHPDDDSQGVRIVSAYIWAEAWRVRHGIVEAFPMVFTESNVALEVLADMRAKLAQSGIIDGVERMFGIEAATDYLVRIRGQSGVEVPRGLTGTGRPPWIHTRVEPIFTEAEYAELSVLHYAECRSAPTRAELLQGNPVLTTDGAIETSERIAAHHRNLGLPDTAEAYSSVARSLLAAQGGRLDEAVALVQDVGYLPTEVQAVRLANAISAGDLRTAAHLARHSIHLVDRQLAPNVWVTANTNQAQILGASASRDAGTSPLAVEEIVLRCLAALRVLDPDTEAWANVCVTLAEAVVGRIRGNRTANLEAATSILTEVRRTGITSEDSARVHLALATAYGELFGNSATENLGRALEHARQALATYEALGVQLDANRARHVLAQVLVRAAEQVRGPARMDLLDSAEEYLAQWDLSAPRASSRELVDQATITYVAQVLDIEDEVVRSWRAGSAPDGQPPRVPAAVLQLLAVCKMLRYSDGIPDLAAQHAAVALHQQVIASIDRDTYTESWARAMFSLANSYTRYPEPTEEMLDRAEEAQRAALDAFEAEGIVHGIALVTMAIGNTAFRRRHWEQAATSLREAAALLTLGETGATGDRGILAQVAELRDTYARLPLCPTPRWSPRTGMPRVANVARHILLPRERRLNLTSARWSVLCRLRVPSWYRW